MRVAVCGFKAFAGVAVNPSRQIVESLERKHRSRGDRSLSFHLLETAYDEDSRRIREVVAEAPEVLVIIGVARHRQSICFERFAVNIDDASVPDNQGVVRSGVPIVLEGPDAFQSNAPLRALVEYLAERQMAAIVSNHAGTFVCNHVFYVALREARRRSPRTLCVFVHVPLPQPASLTDAASASPTLTDLCRAVELTIDCLSLHAGETPGVA